LCLLLVDSDGGTIVIVEMQPLHCQRDIINVVSIVWRRDDFDIIQAIIVISYDATMYVHDGKSSRLQMTITLITPHSATKRQPIPTAAISPPSPRQSEDESYKWPHPITHGIMKTTASWRGTTRGCFKDNMGKIVPASMLLEELQKANGPPLICANVNAETVCDNKSNLKTKFSVMVKNSGKHKRRF
jgi:hypothetical protein